MAVFRKFAVLAAGTVALVATSITLSAQQQPSAPLPPANTNAQPGAAPPQSEQPTGDAQGGGYTLKAFVPEVYQVFTVTDKKGHFVTGLKQQDFGLLDDGRHPERIISFTQQANLPLRIGIMLDTSNSIRTRFQFEQQAATEFLLQVLRPRQDAAFVSGFDVRLDLVQDYTNSIDKLSTAIEKLRPGGGTAFFDAIYQTCRDQMLTVTSNETIRKALIVVSDGEDNYSRVQEQEAIKECQRADTLVYTISTNVSPSRDKGDDVLMRLSEATGGRTFFPLKIEDVAKGFQEIETELRSQYSLRYRPADLKQDGSFRTIYLSTVDQRYHVRARKGYFSPKPPQ
ncbi:VWA domain-containing protein [Terriglobus sp. TAA 43]|uniref:VWA domain-containing protein n=1 Tax=Terriglobus sp. TAA 43 TaxID=278961 RepID=UPI000647EED1|nr:VWA domain-containing protein [Terriglobus sp. TAA 43]